MLLHSSIFGCGSFMGVRCTAVQESGRRAASRTARTNASENPPRMELIWSFVRETYPPMGVVANDSINSHSDGSKAGLSPGAVSRSVDSGQKLICRRTLRPFCLKHPSHTAPLFLPSPYAERCEQGRHPSFHSDRVLSCHKLLGLGDLP
jgi:hypothetical protein